MSYENMWIPIYQTLDYNRLSNFLVYEAHYKRGLVVVIELGMYNTVERQEAGSHYEWNDISINFFFTAFHK